MVRCLLSPVTLQAGGVPGYTLTEDFALGMEMKMRHWCCRYLLKYLAVGEAPEAVRQCYQQRSRWTKVRDSGLLLTVLLFETSGSAGACYLI